MQTDAVCACCSSLLTAGTQIATLEALDLLAIAFAAGYLQRAKDEVEEERAMILDNHTASRAN